MDPVTEIEIPSSEWRKIQNDLDAVNQFYELLAKKAEPEAFKAWCIWYGLAYDVPGESISN